MDSIKVQTILVSFEDLLSDNRIHRTTVFHLKNNNIAWKFKKMFFAMMSFNCQVICLPHLEGKNDRIMFEIFSSGNKNKNICKYFITYSPSVNHPFNNPKAPSLVVKRFWLELPNQVPVFCSLRPQWLVHICKSIQIKKLLISYSFSLESST